ncbi:hypothetical protein J4211_00400 [Candidatus Woesearchaeota archaeon]|nr:hypothetical protein [Candidatus Woesearchaeota archaeon]
MRKQWQWLGLVFLIVFAIRLIVAFQTPFLSSDNSYFHVRMVDAIHAGGLLMNDPLGFGGRTIVASPLFDAIIAFFTYILPSGIVFKLIPNLFASLLVVPAFLLAYKLTEDRYLSLFTALLASIVPAFFAHTFNQLTPLSLAVPLFFMLVYAWLEVPKQAVLFLALLLILVFLHPLALLFVLAVAVYLLLVTFEWKKPQGVEIELGIFTIFFTLWTQFLLYKRLILFHGPEVIWQNIPVGLLSAFYANITVIGAIVQIGVYPLGEGIYALYRTALKNPQKEIQMMLSVTVVSGVLLWLKLIDLETGFTLLGVTLAILFAKWSHLFLEFVRKTRFARFGPVVLGASLVLAIVTTAYPAYAATRDALQGTITQEEVTALSWIDRNVPKNVSVMAPPTYGHYITVFAKRKNVIDDYYLLQPQVNERYDDVARLYRTSFETEAVGIADKYGAEIVVVPPRTRDLVYGDRFCFKRVYGTNIKIYRKNPACSVKVVT